MRYAALLICISAAASMLAVPRYTHQLILEGNDYGTFVDGLLNSRGDVCFIATTSKLDIYVNRTPLTAGISLDAPYLAGFNADRDVLWTQTINRQYSFTNLYENLTSVSDQVPGGTGHPSGAGINDVGLVAWTSFNDYGTPIAYLNTAKIAQQFDIPSGYSAVAAINQGGSVLWQAVRYGDLYVDGFNRTNGMLGSGAVYTPVSLNDHGDIAWNGWKPAWGTMTQHVFLNGTDYTALYAPSDAYAMVVRINNQGHMFWSWHNLTGSSALMLDSVNYLQLVGLTSGSVDGYNDLGDVLLETNFDQTRAKTLLVNGYDLTNEVLAGQTYTAVRGQGINNAGQVFWELRIGGKIRYYLSTPLIQPGVSPGQPSLASPLRWR